MTRTARYTDVHCLIFVGWALPTFPNAILRSNTQAILRREERVMLKVNRTVTIALQ